MLNKSLVHRLLRGSLKRLLRIFYRVEVSGMHNYQAAGPRVVIVANHTSLLDGLLLYAFLPEIPTFAINTDTEKRHEFWIYLKFVDLLHINYTEYLSLKSIVRFLQQDKKIVIFPEGRITTTGSLMKIYDGASLIIDHAAASILPVVIDGAQFVPHSNDCQHLSKQRFPKIKIQCLPPKKITLAADLKGAKRRRQAARQLRQIMYSMPYHAFNKESTLFLALASAASSHGAKTLILEDIERKPMSYRQLLTQALVLSRLIGPVTVAGEYVGVLLPNMRITAVVFFALQAIGRVPAMLNFSMGSDIVHQICQRAGIKTVYTTRRFVAKAQLMGLVSILEKSLSVVYLEDLVAEIKHSDRLLAWIGGRFAERYYRRSISVVDPDATAVVLFTSGSEASPKGVALSHRNLLSNYAQVNCYIDFQPTDILFNCLPVFHSFGLNAGLLMPIFGGSKVFLYPSPLHYRTIPEMIYHLGATILFGSNTFFSAYASTAHPFDFHTLRYVVAGAEKLTTQTQTHWMEKFGIRILQGYGVTETSPVLAVNTPMQNKFGTIGCFVPGIEYVLQSVPGLAEGGRLFVKGANIMRGYLSMRGTETSILPTLADGLGLGWHDTGDIACVDEDGFVSILGRAKRFAKIGGEMVSLGAIEEIAQTLWPDFTHAAMACEDAKKGEHVVLVSDCQQACRRQLQDYLQDANMGAQLLPKKVLTCPELPRLSTGKLDYRAIDKLVANTQK